MIGFKITYTLERDTDAQANPAIIHDKIMEGNDHHTYYVCEIVQAESGKSLGVTLIRPCDIVSIIDKNK